MTPRGRRRTAAFAAAILALACAAPAPVSAQADSDRLRNAKALFFDRKYAEARQAWQAILQGARGAEADAAAYWIARCSENNGEAERAFREYAEFLARRPADGSLVAEARTSRVGLAARLYKDGRKQHLPVLVDAISDESRTIRYYAALQLSSLGADVGKPAIPVLLSIVENEKDPDLVERAKLALLRLDPQALTRAAPQGPSRDPAPRGRQARWFRLRIYEPGGSKPKVSINLPIALADMLFQSLPESAKEDLRRDGYDAEKLWARMRALGPTEILTVEGDDGGKIQIWME